VRTTIPVATPEIPSGEIRLSANPMVLGFGLGGVRLDFRCRGGGRPMMLSVKIIETVDDLACVLGPGAQ